jgi:hypothetical protein
MENLSLFIHIITVLWTIYMVTALSYIYAKLHRFDPPFKAIAITAVLWTASASIHFGGA